MAVISVHRPNFTQQQNDFVNFKANITYQMGQQRKK